MKHLFVLGALAAATPAMAAPINLAGEMCEVSTGICGDLTAELRNNGRGILTVDVLGVAQSGPIQWRANPAAGTVDFYIGGYIINGTLGGGCASGVGTVPSPPSVQFLFGPTMTVAWELCRTP